MNRNLFAGSMAALLGLVLLVGAGTLRAEPMSESKPFAEKFLLLQLSDGEEEKQNKVLSVAGNLLEYYGPDSIDIEVTTFGPGVRLMYADNSRRERISSLMAQGVRFTVCMNTINTIERDTGKRPELHPEIIPVDVGVAHILDEVEKGYVLVRP
ncbi:hypothetical protein DIT71_08305 [Marinobacter vulgaris]|uniref:Sulfur reduction protein DsrE n=1 Tax=Marinobacter vulgaris TaxID=1928331 RepID=A0A2V3ZLP3_9GAMM|nr:hypothetical protein [Marinobacter vulgaris]PXX91845.1 hypothetical protein DIT71_08305 [Marinobacter vulgaris]TSJ70647.1 hypothetical protein FPC41_07065 [Marinobacter vulgaris]